MTSVEYRNACRRCVREVRGQNIDSQIDFRRWALRNHPDKVGTKMRTRSVGNWPDLECADEEEDCLRYHSTDLGVIFTRVTSFSLVEAFAS
mmetsp:Transcript_924/g.2745  ORF Transcript_924/g.2745 Transcript_924/m.2745 type:complete len:91 (+) Transcript_924:386-658(+)